MVKVLHASFLRHYHESIANQLNWEVEAANLLEIQVKTVLALPRSDREMLPAKRVVISLAVENSRIGFLRWIAERYAYAKWLVAASKNYDVVLTRWNYADPFQTLAILRIQVPVYTVHHTLEEHEGRLANRFGFIRSNLDRLLFLVAARKVSGIIGVTQEIVEYELARARMPLVGIVYPNGTSCEDHFELSGIIGDASPPEIVFVASHFSAWQGLDKLLENIASSKRSFLLHLVGNLSAEQMELASRDARIICHGVLSGEHLIEIYKRCAVGLSSFALDRKGMRQATSLKVREYLSYGVPVYSGHEDIFPNDFPFYRKGPPDIDQILKFCQQNHGISKGDVRALSHQYIGKRSIVNRLYRELLDRHAR